MNKFLETVNKIPYLEVRIWAIMEANNNETIPFTEEEIEQWCLKEGERIGLGIFADKVEEIAKFYYSIYERKPKEYYNFYLKDKKGRRQYRSFRGHSLIFGQRKNYKEKVR